MNKKDNINLLYIDLFCGAGGTSTGVAAARHDGMQCAKVVAQCGLSAAKLAQAANTLSEIVRNINNKLNK